VALKAVFGADAHLLRDVNFRVLLFANVLGALGTAAVSPVLDSLIEPFGASGATIGLLMSAFTAPAIVMIPVAGVLMDRYGRRPVLLVSLSLFGLSGVAIAFTTDFRVAIALRALQGVGFAGINPTIITSIGDFYDGSEEATGQGFRFMGSGLTQSVFPLLAGVLVVSAWQYPFALYLVGVPATLAVYWWLDEPLDASRGTTSETANDGGRVDTRTQLGRLLRLAVQPRIAAMILARGGPVIAWIGFLTYNSVLVVRVLGGTPPQAGVLAAMGGFAYATAGSQAGRLAAAFERRLALLLLANVVMATGMAGVAMAPSLSVAVVGIGVMGAGFGVLMSMYRSIVTGLAPAASRGGVVSLAESFGRVTGTLTPVAMGASISVAAPALGFAPAVRWVTLGAGAVAGGIGVVSLLLANVAPDPEPPGRTA
jgi:MFS family permease